MSNLFENYNRLPVAFASGQGCELTDTNGKKYLDFLSGIAVSNLGHSHPKLVAALTDQVSRLLHVSNLYEIPEQEKAAEYLTRFCGQGKLGKAFFCNSGAEANECLLKLARRYAHENGLPPVITVFRHGFHGRTLGTVSATGTEKYHEGFYPLLPGFEFCDLNDWEQTEKALAKSCAVMLEPIQGEGGVIPVDSDFLKKLETHCRENNKLLLLDEVQTGVGRTGKWLCSHHFEVQADAISLAKGLGAGMPVGAVIATTELAALMTPGTHGTTFGGNPLACRAVCTVFETIQEEALLENSQQMGAYLQSSLEKLPGVNGVRGKGLMVAILTERPAKEIAQELFEAGVLVNAVRDHVIRLLPPLVVSKIEIDQVVKILKPILESKLVTEVA